MKRLRIPARHRLRYRLSQGLASFTSTRLPRANEVLEDVLTPEQIAAFTRMSPHDQAHSLRVLGLVSDDADPPSLDLMVAAVFHDIGKVGPGGRVRLLDRVARVGLAYVAPRLWVWLARLPAAGWRAGMVLAEHHPTLGAHVAGDLGCSPRSCWLIEHHADKPIPIDPELRRLVSADHEAR